MSAKLPVLEDCSRLHAKLTVANCVKRWMLAQDADGRAFPESLAVCARCVVGEERSFERAAG